MNRNINKYLVAILISAGVSKGFMSVIEKMADRAGLILTILPFVMVIALFFVLSPVNFIFWVLVFRIPISPFLESTRVFGGMGPGALLNLLVIFGAFIICFRHLKRITAIPFVKCWVIFLVITLISISYSPYKISAVRLWLNNLTYLSMLGIAFSCINSFKELKRWMLMFCWSAMVTALITLVYEGLHGTLLSRVYYPLTHPSVLAHYIVIMITVSAMSAMFLIERGSPLRFPLRLSIGLLTLVLLLTQTRNAWIACWFSFLAFGFMRSRKLIIALCILIPLSLVFLPPVQERIMDAFQNQYQTATQGMNSFAWRRQLWADSFTWILEKPLFGYGHSTFKPYSSTFSKVAEPQGSGAHNVYIELLFEAGILGLVSYVAIFFLLVRQFLIYYKRLNGQREKGIAAMVLVYVFGYLIVCAIDNLQQVLVANWYVWFFIGATYRYLQLSYDQQCQKKTS